MVFYFFNRTFINFLYILTTLIALTLIGIEIYLNSKNTFLCQTSSCVLVHMFDNYAILNYLGFAVFLYLFLISVLDILNFHFEFFINLRTYLLFASIIAEGYLIGFQSWVINTYCEYCLVISALIFLAFFLDYFYSKQDNKFFLAKKEKKPLYNLAILGFLTVFFVVYLVKAPLKSLDLRFPVLIYEENCPHCKEIISYAKEREIKINLYKAKEVIPLIKIVNLNSVPLLLAKVGDNIWIIKGKEAIEKWFEEKYGSKTISEKKEEKIEKGKIYVKEKKKESFPKKIHKSNKSNKAKVYITNDTEEGGVCSIEKGCQ